MKNLTKLFVAVALLMASFACTTDATQDLGTYPGQTTLSISMEESRIHLGEKADGVYPLYWSEGDQISVNGAMSSALTEGGSVNATFSFDGTLSHPYSVIYPASADGHITFPATQTYTPGTFAAGAAPMYGYATAAGETIQMQHLVGVLNIAVSGEATLSSIVLEAEKGNLSGTYAIDCATGALTAVDGTTSNSVTLSFGEGLALTETATPIYIAVPAGEYGMVSAKLYSTEGAVMTVKFDSSTKSITAGAVREFTPIEYNGTIESGDYIIDSKDALIAYAANPTRNAVVTANIDMTGVEWSSIGSAEAPYTGLTFDGGNFEIKGLSAPLFYTIVSSTIKNVKIVDANITITEPFYYDGVARIASGALAYYANSITMENCYASGEIVVNTKFSNADTTELNNNTGVDIAGLIGLIGGSDNQVTKLTNAVNVTVKSLFSQPTDNTFYILAGGITGVIYKATKLTDIYNYGNITFAIEGETQTCTQIRSGGITGYTPNTTTFTNVENHGDFTVSNLNTTSTQYYAGLVGLPYNKPTFDTCKNSGAITVSSKSGGNFVVGSIGGACENIVTVKNCTATNNAKGEGIKLSVSCSKFYSGMVGYIASSTKTLITNTIENCTSSIDMWLTSGFSSTSSTYPTFGFPDTQGSSYSIANMTNYHVSGDIIIEGTISSLLYVGALYGYMRAANAETYLSTFKNCSYSGNIKMNGSFSARTTVGGLVGYNSANYFNMENCHSSGSITFVNNYTGVLVDNFIGIGGIIGYDGQEIGYTSCSNSMDISVSGFCKATNPLWVGGIVGYDARNNTKGSVMNVKNSGNITIGSIDRKTTVNALQVGGIGGYIKNSAAITGYENLVNTGDIFLEGEIVGFDGVVKDVATPSYVGGIFGLTEEPVINATAYCTIYAPGVYNVGWITGVARTNETVYAKNCQIGGHTAEVDQEDETLKLTTIPEETYYNYIYGSGKLTDWTGTENYDGCTYLTSKPE